MLFRSGDENLSESDSLYRESLNAEMKSRARTIANDGYNLKARDFNSKLDRFPANLFKLTKLVGSLELFER